MKTKAEDVVLLVIGDKKVRFEKGKKLKESIILCDNGKAYLRGRKKHDSFMLFLQARVEGRPGNRVDMNDVYNTYLQFCDEYKLPALPPEKFLKAFQNYVEIEKVKEEDKEKLYAKDIELTNYIIEVSNEADYYIYERKGLFRTKRVPVYIVIEGVPKTLTFDEVKGYAIGANGEISVIDDDTMAQIITECMLAGATIGSQKLFSDIKWFTLVNMALTVIVMILVFYCLMNLEQVLQTFNKIL